MSELKPCPFCGSRNVDTTVYWMVECLDCGASSKIVSKEAEAVELWNERPEPSKSEPSERSPQ